MTLGKFESVTQSFSLSLWREPGGCFYCYTEMQCDDDPLSQFTYENGNNCWDEEGAKSRDNNLLQLSTDVEEDGISKRSFQREKCGGGGGVEGSHLSDIRLQNAQSCSSIDRRSLGAEDSSRGDTNTKKSFGNASSSSSTFVPFGSYALGQHRVHHMEQNVDYQVMNESKLVRSIYLYCRYFMVHYLVAALLGYDPMSLYYMKSFITTYVIYPVLTLGPCYHSLYTCSSLHH